MDKDIYVFLNATKLCNLDCKFCFLPAEARKNDNRIVDVDKLISFLNSVEFENKEVELCWEGGELTTIAFDQLSYMIKKIDSQCNVRQTAVTNLYKTEDRFIELVKKYFNGEIETTFAFADKATWEGDEKKYLQKFKDNLTKVLKLGIECPVNFELNKQSLLVEPSKFFDYWVEISNSADAVVKIEIDYSIDFLEYSKHNTVNSLNYPELTLQSSYTEISNYLIELYKEYIIVNKDRKNKILITLFEEIEKNLENRTFNICMDNQYFTINPDGGVASDPLFTEIDSVFIGNIYTDTTKEILSNSQRPKRKLFELERQSQCINCSEFKYCKASSSHVPVYLPGDDECCGFLSLRDFIKKSAPKI